jgi:hypothetical protein
MRKQLQVSALFLGAALLCAPAPGWSQDNGAKQDMKDAGHETKNAAKDTGHGVKQGTKKAWHKTADTTKGAAHGAKEGAKQPE